MKRLSFTAIFIVLATVSTLCGCAKPEEAAPGYVDSPAGATSKKGAPPDTTGKGKALPPNQRMDSN